MAINSAKNLIRILENRKERDKRDQTPGTMDPVTINHMLITDYRSFFQEFNKQLEPPIPFSNLKNFEEQMLTIRSWYGIRNAIINYNDNEIDFKPPELITVLNNLKNNLCIWCDDLKINNINNITIYFNYNNSITYRQLISKGISLIGGLALIGGATYYANT